MEGITGPFFVVSQRCSLTQTIFYTTPRAGCPRATPLLKRFLSASQQSSGIRLCSLSGRAARHPPSTRSTPAMQTFFCPGLRDLMFLGSSVWNAFPPALQILAPSHDLAFPSCHLPREEPPVTYPPKPTPLIPTHSFLLPCYHGTHHCLDFLTDS